MKLLYKVLDGPILQIKDPNDHTKEEVIASFFREIVFLALKYVRPGIELEDLVSEGIMGLLDAIERWDPERSKHNPKGFHILAVVRIKSYMFSYMVENGFSLRLPPYIGRGIFLIDKMEKLLDRHKANYNPEMLQILQHPEEENLPPGAKKTLRKFKSSLKKIADASGKTYEEFFQRIKGIRDRTDFGMLAQEDITPNPEGAIADREFVNKFLDNLNPRVRKVIESLLSGKTLSEVGKESGWSSERVRQVREEAIKFLGLTKMFKDACG